MLHAPDHCVEGLKNDGMEMFRMLQDLKNSCTVYFIGR